MANSTPLIINKVLYYVQNRINNVPDDIIAAACINFYSPEELDSAKSELFHALENISSSDGKRLPTRAAKRDSKKAIEDILTTFKSCDVANFRLSEFAPRPSRRRG